MSILKTDLTLFENLNDWEFKENFTTVTSEFGELDIHFVDENSSSDECVLLHQYHLQLNHKIGPI